MQQIKKKQGWTFVGENADFTMEQPHETSYLYFPLTNEAGMMSAITPTLHGSSTSGHYTFFMPPVSIEDLHNSRSSRNFWLHIEGKGAWACSGNSAKQTAERFQGDTEQVTLDAGFLWHKITRVNPSIGIQAEIVSFVPMTSDKVELMKVTVTNTGKQMLTLTPTAAIPLYGRSADELRDHRHVTSLLHRIYTSTYGMEVQPALSFDERGHRVNHVTYSVLGAAGEGRPPIGFIPIAEDYIGEGGSFDWPQAVVANEGELTSAGVELEGYEAVGALRFEPVSLKPGESAAYTIAMIISDDRLEEERVTEQYLAAGRFDELLEENKRIWSDKLSSLQFQSGNRQHDQWMKWVTIQPIFRRLYGNSFLPYHDYGRGGRGWRDLWQDCLALLFMEPAEVRHLLLNNFAGVRIDGSNATIIGAKPGEFVADRNNIPRVWMDHGAWPFLTTMLYLHQSGDVELLLEKQTYFKDSHAKRCKEKDLTWKPEDGQALKTADGRIYEGTILEHLLLQNLVPFFHVGEHNNMKLEGADWNDGLDLAPDRGESVAFTAFYGNNMRQLAELLRNVQESLGVNQIELAEEIVILLDTLRTASDYDSVSDKRALLEKYYEACIRSVSGRKVLLPVEDVSRDLQRKADWVAEHLRKHEWIRSGEGYEWFNGYYNNSGERVEGDHPNGVRMTLTGQVFTVMGGVATREQVEKIVASVNRYLRDPRIGYRLNSNFGGIQQNLGRAFGFAFGHKENGAMFSHMTVMYANALYKQGFVKEGHEVLSSIYELSTDFERSRMYPGIPEYINEKGRGMYPYLTGSASWLLLTQLTEVYGVKGSLGDLLLEPKLVRSQFDEKQQSAVTTLFAGKLLKITYRNPAAKEYGEYRIGSVFLNGEEITGEAGQSKRSISREKLLALAGDEVHHIEVILS
ncbi:GH36-type glycosyl hydrolase domain-containing protein [Paenibacillus turpanensis]|uniref:GH36-type glycosyl hydrolase domain-containing protein n=1 Tax=Paenibacillus turpanensis TaxID=2689078 RepID=UPI001A9D4C61|nr:cellobiose phosphorylase [Paenibacillus turpanensis]